MGGKHHSDAAATVASRSRDKHINERLADGETLGEVFRFDLQKRISEQMQEERWHLEVRAVFDAMQMRRDKQREELCKFFVVPVMRRGRGHSMLTARVEVTRQVQEKWGGNLPFRQRIERVLATFGGSDVLQNRHGVAEELCEVFFEFFRHAAP